MKSAGKARNNGLYRHIRTSKEIIRNLLNDLYNSYDNSSSYSGGSSSSGSSSSGSDYSGSNDYSGSSSSGGNSGISSGANYGWAEGSDGNRVENYYDPSTGDTWDMNGNYQGNMNDWLWD